MFVKRRSRYSKYKYRLLLGIAVAICFLYITHLLVDRYSKYIPVRTIAKEVIHAILSTLLPCRAYIVSNNRTFFEREQNQTNLPRRISNASYEQALRQLPLLRLVAVACGRNVAKYIDTYRRHIEPIVDLFHSTSRILIFENDSRDQTVAKLRQWPRAQVYNYGRLFGSYPERTDRLAYCRNVLLEKAYALAPDYILIVDMDIFSTNVPSFLSNFQYDRNDWSVMSAASRGGYYDIWALRTLSDSILNYDVWHRVFDLERSLKNYCSESVVEQTVYIHKKKIPDEHPLIEVRSAFNGAGLYKANFTYGCKYNGAENTCEHVPFHQCIREKHQGRIFINPAFHSA